VRTSGEHGTSAIDQTATVEKHACSHLSCAPRGNKVPAGTEATRNPGVVGNFEQSESMRWPQKRRGAHLYCGIGAPPPTPLPPPSQNDFRPVAHPDPSVPPPPLCWRSNMGIRASAAVGSSASPGTKSSDLRLLISPVGFASCTNVVRGTY
jgi:hypothetical protein